MDFWAILKIIFFLALILGLMYLLMFIIKKYFYSFDQKSPKLFKIKVLSTQMILPKKYIQVVQVQDRILVLGVTDGSINVLSELENSSVVSEEMHGSKADFKDNFLDILKKNLGVK